ncbi:hypothetical protein L208DRAFT_1026569, partial [Tricholoma matsutake]
LAKAFQKMLESYGLKNKILSVTANNVAPNDIQREALTGMDNDFQAENHIHCFNHTLQL